MPSLLNSSILIVDNNRGDQLVLEDEIRSTSLPIKDIVFANTLYQAKKVLSQKDFSLIFLDLFLPDSLGLSSFTELQKVNTAVPIIVFSGFEDKKNALKAISLGAQDFLIKGGHNIEMLEKTIEYSIERKKNLEIIKGNNDRHETLLKVTNDVLWDWDMVTNKVAWSGIGINKYLPSNINYGDKVPAFFWLRRLHPDERKKVLVSIYDVISTKQNFWQSEFKFLRNDSQYSHIYSRGYIISNDENKPVRMIGSMQDITDKKLADEKLAVGEKRFKSLIKYSSDLIALLDKDGRYLYVSDSTKNILGYEPDSLTGKYAFSFVHPDDRINIEHDFAKALDSGFTEFRPFRFPDINGEWRWLHSTAINMLNEKAIAGIVINSRDITSNMKAEKQLEQASLSRQKDVTEAMIEGQEKERSEIGRELHDNVNQILVATKLFIERAITYDINREELLSSAVTYIMGAIEEIRKLSKTLITPIIKDIGLVEAIEGLAQDIMQVNPVTINLDAGGLQQETLNEKFKLNVFRIVQEQVNNILKHAQAKQINIIFKQISHHILICINDDGIGFDTNARKRGVGISNIFNRAGIYKGDVKITSAPGCGCKMEINFKDLSLLM